MAEDKKTKKSTPVFWITDNQDPKALDLVLSMQEMNHEVFFFESVAELKQKLPKKRSRTILFGLHSNDDESERQLLELVALPELNGAAFILEGYDQKPGLKRVAAACNFRDIIPRDLSSGQFIHRFLVANNRKTGNSPWNGAEIRINQKAIGYLPSRLTWIDTENLRFEAPFLPQPGSLIWLKGGIFEHMGLEKVRVEIKERQNQNLSYRFSNAYIAKWSLGKDASTTKADIVDVVQSLHTKQQLKVFLAVQSATLRNKLIGCFKNFNCDVRAALSRNSIFREPLFLTPDIIIFEDSLFSSETFKKELRESIAGDFESCRIWTLDQTTASGGKAFFDTLEPKSDRFQFQSFPKTSPDLLEKLTEALPEKSLDSEKAIFPMHHAYSLVESVIPCQMDSLFPLGGAIGLPAIVRPYSLMRIEWNKPISLDKKTSYLKLLEQYRDFSQRDSFQHSNKFVFADFDRKEQFKLLENAIEHVESEWNSFLEVFSGDLPSEPKEESKPEMKDPEILGIRSMEPVSAKPADLIHHHVDINPSANEPLPMHRTSVSGTDRFLREYKGALIAVSAITFVFSVIYFSFKVLAPRAPSSGRIFSEQFEKFADPKLRTKPPFQRNEKPESPEN